MSTKYTMKENSGSLFRNENKREDKHPDYTGSIMIGDTEKRISAWLKEGKKGKFLSLQISDIQPRQSSTPSSSSSDGLPF